jgi:hypothetical protein
MRRIVVTLLLVVAASDLPAPSDLFAQLQRADRAVYVDDKGVVRWQDDRREVTLFGANYVLPGASDYRAAGYVGADRKRVIDQDMAHFARMGWDGIRLTFWGDWEAADTLGNLIANDHLDLLDYLTARARERGIYMLFSPIQLYGANWPDALGDTTAPGFGRRYDRSRMGTDPAAIAAQANYLRQILNHVNPYTGVAYKDEPAIVFIELVNEPVHHPEDLEGSVRYINTLVDAVRSTGCTKLITYNVSQDFRIGEAILKSKAQGLTYGWYPTGLNSGRELEGNFLRSVDDYPHLLDPALARLPRIVYEFDVPDTRSAAMYAAMARTFRTGGIQLAAMFSYDMLATASRNLGWQTHYLNLAYTPHKAMGAIIAAEAMRRLPRGKAWGRYPENTRFGDFRIGDDPDHAELVAADAFLYAGSTSSVPKDLLALRRIAGVGSSPVVRYDGDGIYFLDRLRPGVWRLEVYPDAVPVRDPFEPPSPGKIVTRAISRPWPMTVTLPDLGGTFTVQVLRQPEHSEGAVARAVSGRFTITPGVYLLSASGTVDVTTLPSHLGPLGLREYHAPPPDTLPVSVQVLTPPHALAGRDLTVRARVADATPPDSVTLYLKPAGRSFERAIPMRPSGGYVYAAAIPASALPEGPHQFVVSVFRGGKATTFPAGAPGKPWDWDYHQQAAWPLEVAGPGMPLRLFDPGTDAERLAFSRIGDAGRRGLFQIGRSALTGQPVFRFEYPRTGSGPEGNDYTASLVIRDRVVARQATIADGETVRLRLRGLGPRQTLHLTLMEQDGTSWTVPIEVDSSWREPVVPLSAFTAGRGVLLPQGFPQQWNYWVGPASGRGGAGDRPQLERLERLQLSLRAGDGAVVAPGGYGVEVEWVVLAFASATGR